MLAGPGCGCHKVWVARIPILLPRIALLLLLLPLWKLAAEEPTLRVATYNLRNYLCMDRLMDDGFRREYPKPESEKRVVRETIRAVSPDVLILQELGGPNYLAELQTDLAREGLVYTGAALAEAQDEERHVGALWKNRIMAKATTHADLRFPYFDDDTLVKRGMLELVIHDSGGNAWASIFGLHLKSKYTTDNRDPMSEERRVREAQAARNRILERFPDPNKARFLIVGDLNDGPNSRALQRFKTRGDVRIAYLLQSRDPFGLTWTHYYKKGGMYSQIDHILASSGWPELRETTATIESPPDYYDGSDHRLVWVDVPITADVPSTGE